MRAYLKNAALFIALLVSSSAVSYSQDQNKILEAVKSGDFAEALRKFKPLAEQGNAQAQYNLGIIYHEGLGVAQDYKTALKWFSLAAERGIALAQYNLGVMNQKGRGVAKNYKTAVKWYSLAAEQGIAPAQFNLGTMYYNGQGGAQNDIRAHLWFNTAASNGVDKAAEIRKNVSEQMTPADISKAQRMARECVEKNYKGC